MKIGIITSGNDMLTLFKFLTKYDHEYIIYYDQAHRPYGDRTFEEGMACMQEGINFLIKQKVDFIVLPPVFELALLCHSGLCHSGLCHSEGNEEYKGKKKKVISFDSAQDDIKRTQDDIKNKILPLFREYVMQECFAHSLVGKIGAFGDYADVGIIQKYLRALEKKYKLSDAQKATKKFHSPFAYRVKEVSLWKYFLTKLSFSHMMVNRVVKEDLKYFKDAMVDTVIPLNYGYFNYQTTIAKFFNFKKIRFHKLEKIEGIFQSVTQHLKLKTSNYTVKVYYTGHVDFLKGEKRIMWLMERGKKVEVEFKEI